MMNIIQFKEANCKSCYKCIRSCDVKAISFKDEQARIIEDACVLCGTCTLVCPQNAKHMKSDLPQVKEYLKWHQYIIILNNVDGQKLELYLFSG